ncbi:3'-5' exonuclease ['Camptotheca acuminata' phytoplasma]|uniref:3'-5' exonuclease n=1 Tax='Camptotheca acuminata' phytoplasma TaxID=3239192 RepID=UPI00351A8337
MLHYYAPFSDSLPYSKIQKFFSQQSFYDFPFTDDLNNTENKIILSTIHAYKGFQNEIIFLFLWPRHNHFHTDMINEKKLLYVTFSRAQKDLYVITDDKNNMFKSVFKLLQNQNKINYHPFNIQAEKVHLELNSLFLDPAQLIADRDKLTLTSLLYKTLTNQNFLIRFFDAELDFSYLNPSNLSKLQKLIDFNKTIQNQIKIFKEIDYGIASHVNVYSLKLDRFFLENQIKNKLRRDKINKKNDFIMLNEDLTKQQEILKESIKQNKKNPVYKQGINKNILNLNQKKRNLENMRRKAQRKALKNFTNLKKLSFLTLTTSITNQDGTKSLFGRDVNNMQKAIKLFFNFLKKQLLSNLISKFNYTKE